MVSAKSEANISIAGSAREADAIVRNSCRPNADRGRRRSSRPRHGVRGSGCANWGNDRQWWPSLANDLGAVNATRRWPSSVVPVRNHGICDCSDGFRGDLHAGGGHGDCRIGNRNDGAAAQAASHGHHQQKDVRFHGEITLLLRVAKTTAENKKPCSTQGA